MFKFLSMILLTSTIASAERIHGPANVREGIKGGIILSLHDNVEIDLGEMTNDWYELAISLSVTEKQHEIGMVKKGEKLFDGRGTEIGVALKDLILVSKSSGGGAPGVRKWYGADVYGFTFKGNIRPESIVEPVISELIESNLQNLTFSIFKKHMEYFGYDHGLDVKNMRQYSTWMIYESILDDISPLDRIRLIFEGDQLVAVVHSRDLNLKSFETVPIARGRKLTLINKFSAEDKRMFIQKNIETYSGID